MKDTSEYALYKGEQMLTIGTLDELAAWKGVTRKTIQFYRYASYQNRAKNSKNRMIVIPLD